MALVSPGTIRSARSETGPSRLVPAAVIHRPHVEPSFVAGLSTAPHRGVDVCLLPGNVPRIRTDASDAAGASASRSPAARGRPGVQAVTVVEDEVRELVRRRGLDPVARPGRRPPARRRGHRRLRRAQRSTASLPPLVDSPAGGAGRLRRGRRVRPAAALPRRSRGRGDLDQRADRRSSSPGAVVHELTTTVLTADEVRDLVEKMLKSSGRRVDLSTPFVDAMLPDGSRLHVAIPDITRAHWSVNIRKFVVRATHLEDLVALGTLTPQAARSSRRRSSSGPQHPGRRRDAGRQDDVAQLPRRGDPDSRARGHRGRGLRAQGPAAGRRRDAVPAAEPRGHRRDQAASPGEGGAAHAARRASSSARSARRSASTC